MSFSMIAALIKKYHKLLISVMLVSALGCAIFLCLPASSNSLEYTLNRYVSEYDYPDAFYTIETTDREKVSALSGVEGIKSISPRMCADLVMISPVRRYLSVRAFSYSEEEKDNFYYWDIKEKEDLYGILLEKDFADSNNIVPGDVLQIKIGAGFMECYVYATVSEPETMSVQPTDDFWDNNSDFGYIYVSDEIIEEESQIFLENSKKQLDDKTREVDDKEKQSEDEINKKKDELDAAKAEYESEKLNFEEKKKELDETVKQLQEAKEELKKSRDKLAKKKLEIIEKQEEGVNALSELNKAKEDLLDKKKQLLAGKTEYENGLKEYENKKAEYDKKKAEYDAGLKEYSEGVKKAEAARKELDEAETQLIAAKNGLAEIDAGLVKVAAAKAELKSYESDLMAAANMPRDMKISELTELKDGLMKLVDALMTNTYIENPSNIREIKNVVAQIISDDVYLNLTETSVSYMLYYSLGRQLDTAEYREFYAAVNRYVNAGSSISLTEFVTAKEKAKQIAENIKKEGFPDKLELFGGATETMGLIELYETVDSIKKGADILEEKSGIKVETIEDMQTAYKSLCDTADASEKELRGKRAEVIKKLSEAGVNESEIDSKLAEIAKGREELAEGDKELALAAVKIESAKNLLDEGKQELTEADNKLKQAKKEIDDNSEKLEAGLKEIDDNIGKIEAALSEAETGLAAIEDGGKQVDENEKKIEDGLSEIDSKVSEGEKALADAEKEIAEGEKKLEETEIDVRKQFYEAREEIAKAAAEIKDFKGYQTLCNQLMIRLDDGADTETVQKGIGDFLKDIEVRKKFFYEDSPVKKRIDNNIEPMKRIVNFLPVVFFVITLVVVFLFMSLIIKQCRKEIGILRALGFSKAKVRGMFCLLNFAVSIPAVLLGTGIGLLITRYTVRYFTDYLSVPLTCYVFDVKLMIMVGLIVIATGQAATLLGSSIIDRIMPAEAMSRSLPEDSSISPVIEKLIKKASPMSKYSMITLFRNKKRFFFSVLCISSTIVLIYSGMSFISSKNLMMHNLFDKSINYDCQVFFDGKLPDETFDEIDKLGFISEAARLNVYTVEIEFNGKMQKERINTLPEGCTLIAILDENGEKIELPGEGIVLEKRFAESMGIKAGNVISVDGNAVRVTAISTEPMNPTHYMSDKQAAILKKLDYGCVICKIAKDDENLLQEFLDGKEGYILSTYTRILKSGSNKVFATFDTFAWIIIVFAILIGMQIVINIARTNLFEQKRNLCVLRTLGFTKASISIHWFLQLLLSYVFSLMIGLPLGVVFAKEALRRLSEGNRDFAYAGGIRDYTITAVFVFAFVLLSHLISVRMMNKWDLAESIKEKE